MSSTRSSDRTECTESHGGGGRSTDGLADTVTAIGQAGGIEMPRLRGKVIDVKKLVGEPRSIFKDAKRRCVYRNHAVNLPKVVEDALFGAMHLVALMTNGDGACALRDFRMASCGQRRAAALSSTSCRGHPTARLHLGPARSGRALGHYPGRHMEGVGSACWHR